MEITVSQPLLLRKTLKPRLLLPVVMQFFSPTEQHPTATDNAFQSREVVASLEERRKSIYVLVRR